jgi:membrane protein DedA with SNARE-associated domain
MLHTLIAWWFTQVSAYGYAGVVAAMAAESSIIPLPSEVVIPPAAYWASQGKMNIYLVVVAGTLGSWLGATMMYWASRWLGRPLVLRYGKYVLVTPEKLIQAETFLARFHTGGVFFARLLPVVRHLIGIPAGIVRMPFAAYSAVTLLGSGLWCSVLAWFGQRVLGKEPNLISDPEAMVHVLKANLMPIVAAIVVLTLTYVAAMFLTRKKA